MFGMEQREERGLVSLVSDRPSVRTTTAPLESREPANALRAKSRASPVYVPPAIHRMFFTALDTQWERLGPFSSLHYRQNKLSFSSTGNKLMLGFNERVPHQDTHSKNLLILDCEGNER